MTRHKAPLTQCQSFNKIHIIDKGEVYNLKHFSISHLANTPCFMMQQLDISKLLMMVLMVLLNYKVYSHFTLPPTAKPSFSA